MATLGPLSFQQVQPMVEQLSRGALPVEFVSATGPMEDFFEVN